MATLPKALSTPELWLIWLIEAINYGVHVIWRPTSWNPTSVSIGYALWAMQLACFARCQSIDPGIIAESWCPDDESHSEASVCKRSGRRLPPRALYVRHAGAAIAGLDHHCFWIGTPIGYRNRKFFILFIGYSAVFCAMGAAHSAYEIGVAAPSRLGAPPLLDSLAATAVEAYEANREPPPSPISLMNGAERVRLTGRAVLFAAWAWAGDMHGRALDAAQAWYLCAVCITLVANTVAAVLLGFLTLSQTLLAAFNRTTVAPLDTRYDVGLRANWAQVFGARPLLWLLPVMGDGPTVDGMHYPLSPRWVDQKRALRARQCSPDEQSPPPSELLEHVDGTTHAQQAAPIDASTPGGRRKRPSTALELMRSVCRGPLRFFARLLRGWLLFCEQRFCCGVIGVGTLRLFGKLILIARQGPRPKLRVD